MSKIILFHGTSNADIDAEIDETEQQLCAMLDELTGSTFDMKGINEFKALLQGE